MKSIREHFPMLKKDLVYLDSSALNLKPNQVIDSICDFYTNKSISNRTRDSILGIETDNQINQARENTAKFLNAKSSEIIFNSGTTEGINSISYMLENLINEGDEIVISTLNHNSNIIPWTELAKRKKAKVIFSLNIIEDIGPKTKIVAYSQKNNTLQKHVSPKKLYEACQRNQAILINDAAQAVIYENVSLTEADVIIFSANKFFGPTGFGVLAVREKLLDSLYPYKFGGGQIDQVYNEKEYIIKDHIAKFEAGTPNIAGIYGFNAALKFYFDFIETQREDLDKHLNNISSFAFDELNKLELFEILSQKGESIILLKPKIYSSQDIASYLGHNNIYVRAGSHCAHLSNNEIIKSHTLRISLHYYNDKSDIVKLIDAIKKGGDFLDFL